MDEKKLNEQPAGVSDGLTGELKEKLKACKGPEELAALLAEAGVALPDEVLDAAAGGTQAIPPEWFMKDE